MIYAEIWRIYRPPSRRYKPAVENGGVSAILSEIYKKNCEKIDIFREFGVFVVVRNPFFVTNPWNDDIDNNANDGIERNNMTNNNSGTNGASLEDCHSNLFFLVSFIFKVYNILYLVLNILCLVLNILCLVSNIQCFVLNILFWLLIFFVLYLQIYFFFGAKYTLFCTPTNILCFWY